MSATASVLAAARTLDERAYALLVALTEHKVLSTSQIEVLFFGSRRTAQRQLKELRDLGFIASFCASERGARQPDQHFLTDAGARLVAWHLGRRRWDLSVPAGETEARATRAHDRGVTGFLCDLVAACAEEPGWGVHAFARERAVRAGDRALVPDGTARLLHPGGAVEFYFEYDRGTERFGALREKLLGYLLLASRWPADTEGSFPCVLWVVPYESRERMISNALRSAVQHWDPHTASSARLPFYVTHRAALIRAFGHLGEVWRDLLSPRRRLSFAQLPSTDGSLYNLRECLGRRWGEEDEDA